MPKTRFSPRRRTNVLNAMLRDYNPSGFLEQLGRKWHGVAGLGEGSATQGVGGYVKSVVFPVHIDKTRIIGEYRIKIEQGRGAEIFCYNGKLTPLGDETAMYSSATIEGALLSTMPPPQEGDWHRGDGWEEMNFPGLDRLVREDIPFAEDKKFRIAGAPAYGQVNRDTRIEMTAGELQEFIAQARRQF